MALKNEIGSFCWYSLMTKDVEKANTFYTQLFNWKLSTMDFPGGNTSTLYSVEDCTFGNPVPFNGGPAPSHWMSYIAVDDVDRSAKRVDQYGGKICQEAFDLPGVGRTAIVQDPSGAAFHIFTPQDRDSKMNVIDKNLGQVCWMELMVDDVEPLLPFYSEMFGWKIEEPMSMNEGMYYSFSTAAGDSVGGFMKRPPSAPQMPPHWMPYFFVSNIEEFSTKAKTLGAKIVMPPTAVPETGSFSCIEDPTGAHSYLFQFHK